MKPGRASTPRPGHGLPRRPPAWRSPGRRCRGRTPVLPTSCSRAAASTGRGRPRAQRPLHPPGHAHGVAAVGPTASPPQVPARPSSSWLGPGLVRRPRPAGPQRTRRTALTRCSPRPAQGLTPYSTLTRVAGMASRRALGNRLARHLAEAVGAAVVELGQGVLDLARAVPAATPPASGFRPVPPRPGPSRRSSRRRRGPRRRHHRAPAASC